VLTSASLKFVGVSGGVLGLPSWGALVTPPPPPPPPTPRAQSHTRAECPAGSTRDASTGACTPTCAFESVGLPPPGPMRVLVTVRPGGGPSKLSGVAVCLQVAASTAAGAVIVVKGPLGASSCQLVGPGIRQNERVAALAGRYCFSSSASVQLGERPSAPDPETQAPTLPPGTYAADDAGCLANLVAAESAPGDWAVSAIGPGVAQVQRTSIVFAGCGGKDTGCEGGQGEGCAHVSPAGAFWTAPTGGGGGPPYPPCRLPCRQRRRNPPGRRQRHILPLRRVPGRRHHDAHGHGLP
jgi:hypothetical protein